MQQVDSAVQGSEKGTKKRLFYLDFVRVLSVFLIVLTHFNNPYLTEGGYLLTNRPFGIYIGNLGVSQFLIISATALTVTYHRPLQLRQFYKKRFLGIYPMFWLAWIVATLSLFVWHHGNPVNGAPVQYFPLTVLAMDGMAANFGIPNMYLLGEWFLGFIVIFYIVFPLLLWAVQTHPWISGAAGLGIYAATLAIFVWHPPLFPASIILPVRLPELMFGIYFATYWKRIHPLFLLPAGAVLVASSALSFLPADLLVTLVGIAFFTVVAFVATYLDVPLLQVPVQLISKYSYAIFLVHHVVIQELYNAIDFVSLKASQRVLGFAAACLLSYLLGVALFHGHQRVMKYARRAFTWPQRA